MSVSVILVNWNSGNLLAECLQHLERQTVPPEYIFVVDNDSTDGSADIKDVSVRVTVLKMADNIGFAAANNRALDRCTTEFVVLLNIDAFPEPDWIEQLLKAALRYPDAAAFGSRQLSYENPNILDGIGDGYHLSGLVWRNGHGRRWRSQDLITHEIFSPCAAAAMYRLSALVEVNGFDEDYFCYVEDVDLGFRLRLAGYKAIYVPDAVVRHMGSVITGGQRSDFSVYYGHRNLVWTYIKNMPGLLFWFLLPLHLLLNIVTIGVFTLRGQLRIILKAKLDAIKKIPQTWMKRKRIQAERIAKIQAIWKILDKHLLPRKKTSFVK
jgi:GT2 family glycosyltransferase